MINDTTLFAATALQRYATLNLAAFNAAMNDVAATEALYDIDGNLPEDPLYMFNVNQVINQAATLYWRTQVPCPITIRLPGGGTSGSGPFHSQSMEALYAHYPGLVVMTPATVEDAYSMLLDAVAIDDPVIFLEHKFLYYHLKAEKLPTEALPVGKARLAREGGPRLDELKTVLANKALRPCH